MILCFCTACLSFWQVDASHLDGHLLCLPTCSLGVIQENMTIRQLSLSLWRLENIWGISHNSTEKKLLQRLTKPKTNHASLAVHTYSIGTLRQRKDGGRHAA